MAQEKICPKCFAANPPILKKCQKCQATLDEGVGDAPGVGQKISLSPSPAPGPAPPTLPSKTPYPAVANRTPPPTPTTATSAAPTLPNTGIIQVTVTPNVSGAGILVPKQTPSTARSSGGPVKRLPARILIGAIAVALLGVVVWLVKPGTVTQAEFADAMSAVVQVNTEGGSGTGFFIDGPDEWTYIATAFHIVEGGYPITIARARPTEENVSYVEVYPDAELAAYDLVNDLAIIRLPAVKAKTFQTLPKSSSVQTGMPIHAIGFSIPNNKSKRNFGPRMGSIGVTGSIDVDVPRHENHQNKTVNGMEIAASHLDEGYIGGPICNKNNEVVGIIINKKAKSANDYVAIPVGEVNNLVGELEKSIKTEQKASSDPPEKDPNATLKAEVKLLVDNIWNKWLNEPPEGRLKQFEHEYIAISDMPKLRTFVASLQTEERNLMAIEGFNNRLPGSAYRNLQLLAVTGLSLETYHGEDVQKELRSCQASTITRTIFQILLDGTKSDKGEDLSLLGAIDKCNKLPMRPLACDLTAMTLHWNAYKETRGELEIVEVKKTNNSDLSYSAKLRAKGSPNESNFEIFLGRVGNNLKLKLFNDTDDLPYGIKEEGTRPSELFDSSWKYTSTESRLHKDLDSKLKTEERLQVSKVDPNQKTVTVTRIVNAQIIRWPRKSRGCVSEPIAITIEQVFTGEVRPRGIFVKPTKPYEKISYGMPACKNDFEPFRSYLQTNTDMAPMLAMTLKSEGSKLIAHRTSGSETLTEVTFEREGK